MVPSKRGEAHVSECLNAASIAASPEFKKLLSDKKSFILPTVLLLVAFILSYSFLAGIAPRFMSMKLFGSVTVIYVFSIAVFFVGWLVAWRYSKVAERFDATAQETLEKAGRPGHEE